jgi:hypothetical protein
MVVLAVGTVHAHPAQRRGQSVVVGRHEAAVPEGAEVLAGKERETAHAPDPTHQAALVGGPDGLRGVFDERYAGASCDVEERIEISALAAALRRMRVHGADRQYYHQVVGGNFRLDALQAAILRVKLPHLAAWTAARRRNAARYDQFFADAGLTDRVALPVVAPDCHHIFNQYVIRLPHRDAVKAHLESRHVGCAIYYPVPFHEQACFASLGYRTGQFPHAEKAARETLALPIYGELSADQQRYVVSVIAEALIRSA